MTKIRSVRLADDIWEKMRKMADKENVNISDIMKRILIKDLTGGKDEEVST